MGATITETLMALGDFQLDLDYDADLVAELDFFRHVRFYWGEEVIYTGVLLRRRIGRERVTIGGRSLEWWLGLDDDGPLIEDREYLACTNKLSNPGLELGDLYWKTGEGSLWTIREQAGEPRTGTWAAAVTGDFTKDDVLASDERFEAAAGNQYLVSAWVKRPSGTVGRLRLRTKYEGRFDPPNLVTNGNFATTSNWADTSEYAADAAIESGHLRLGPTTEKELLGNPSFETGDFTYWATEVGATWWDVDLAHPRTGLYGLIATPPTGGYGVLTADSVPPGPDAEAFSVTAGERWRAQGHFADNDGSPPDGEIFIRLTQQGPDFPDDIVVIDTQKVTPSSASGDVDDWRLITHDFDIERDHDAVFLAVIVDGMTTGEWLADDFSLRRIKGNAASYETTFSVTPERTYRVLANVSIDAAVQSGDLRALVKCEAAGRDAVTLESPAIAKDEDNLAKLLSWDFMPPSGYTTATLQLVVRDVIGGSFIVDNVSVTDQDRSTVAYDDEQTTVASYTQITGTTTAPAGTEFVSVEVVVESQGTGWVVDDVSISRVGTPDVAADIVAELLVDPETGAQLVDEGAITGPDTLVYDWHIRNMTNRQALAHLSRSGVVDPTREWRVNPDNTLDWGEAADLFVDRTEVVLAEADLVVIGLPEVEESAETRLTRVKVIGAERQLPTGARVLITGEATNDPGDAEDWNGEPLNRTRLIEDSTVDHRDYASALAAYDAERNSDRKQAVQMGVSDWRALGDFSVGDWVYIYKPESDIEDLSNPVTHHGTEIFPQQQRVLSRTWRLGAGPFRAEIRASDGSTVDITESVRWEKDTTAQIEVGDLLPEFAADPQGGAAGVQFRRFRGSRAS